MEGHTYTAHGVVLPGGAGAGAYAKPCPSGDLHYF